MLLIIRHTSPKTGLGRRLPRSQYLAKKAQEQAVQAVELADTAKNDLKQQVVRGIHTIRATGTAQNEAMRELIDKAVVRLGKETIDATEVEAKVMQSRISFQRLFQDIQKLTNNLVGWATAIITGESGYVVREKREKVLDNKADIEKNPLYNGLIDSQIEQVIETYESHLKQSGKIMRLYQESNQNKAARRRLSNQSSLLVNSVSTVFEPSSPYVTFILILSYFFLLSRIFNQSPRPNKLGFGK